MTEADDSATQLARVQSRLGITFCFDTNLVDDRSATMEELRELHRAGWINLTRTDTVDLELADHPLADKRERLLAESRDYAEYAGPLTFDHSRWDHAVWGGDTDADRFYLVRKTLFPESDPLDETAPRAKQRLRDAKHVDTAIRYGANGLITKDRKDLLSRAEPIKEAFNGFLIVDPDQALTIVKRLKARHDVRSST